MFNMYFQKSNIIINAINNNIENNIYTKFSPINLLIYYLIMKKIWIKFIQNNRQDNIFYLFIFIYIYLYLFIYLIKFLF